MADNPSVRIRMPARTASACIRQVGSAHCALGCRRRSWNYAALLNNVRDRLLMRRVGGCFAFWRRRLRDFLARLRVVAIAGPVL